MVASLPSRWVFKYSSSIFVNLLITLPPVVGMYREPGTRKGCHYISPAQIKGGQRLAPARGATTFRPLQSRGTGPGTRKGCHYISPPPIKGDSPLSLPDALLTRRLEQA